METLKVIKFSPELHRYLGPDFQLRDPEQITAEVISLPPSGEKFAGTSRKFTGLEILRVSHIPLLEAEAGVLGLEPRQDNAPYRATISFVDFPSFSPPSPAASQEVVAEYENVLQRARALSGQPQRPIQQYHGRHWYWQIAKSSLGRRWIADDQTGGSGHPLPSEPVTLLNSAMAQAPDKDLLFIHGHGDGSPKYLGDRFGRKVDLLEYFLSRIRPGEYAAIIDGACNPAAVPPEIPILPTPYFCALGRVATLAPAGSAVIQNGETHIYPASAESLKFSW